MNKQNLIKMILFFLVSFVIILTLMTVILGSLQPTPVLEAGADSTLVESDSLLLANSPPPGITIVGGNETSVLDSLRQLVQDIEERNFNLQQRLMDSSQDKPEPNTSKVAKIYEKMGAEEAANILTGLQIDIAAKIIVSMNQRQAAKVLAAMEPGRAIEISKKIAVMD